MNTNTINQQFSPIEIEQKIREEYPDFPSNNESNQKIFQLVCNKGYIKFVKLLLTYPDVDPTYQYNHSIKSASSKGHLMCVHTHQEHA